MQVGRSGDSVEMHIANNLPTSEDFTLSASLVEY
jgi:hypothetical protein